MDRRLFERLSAMDPKSVKKVLWITAARSVLHVVQRLLAALRKHKYKRGRSTQGPLLNLLGRHVHEGQERVLFRLYLARVGRLQ